MNDGGVSLTSVPFLGRIVSRVLSFFLETKSSTRFGLIQLGAWLINSANLH